MAVSLYSGSRPGLEPQYTPRVRICIIVKHREPPAAAVCVRLLAPCRTFCHAFCWARRSHKLPPLALPAFQPDRTAGESVGGANLINQEPLVVRRQSAHVIDEQPKRWRLRGLL